ARAGAQRLARVAARVAVGRALQHRRGRARAAARRRVAGPPQAGHRRRGGAVHPPGLARRTCAKEHVPRGRSVSARRPRLPWWRPRRSRWAQYVALAVVAVALVVGGVWLSRAYERLMGYPERPGPGTGDLIAVAVPKGAGFPQVLAQLTEAGVIPEGE